MRDSGSPARLTVRTEDGRPPLRTSSAIAEGTVLTSVTSPDAARSGSARALSARITAPPRTRGRKISKTDRSKLIDVAASTPASSSGEKTSEAQSSRATALRCSIRTPLGRPVEPDV